MLREIYFCHNAIKRNDAPRILISYSLYAPRLLWNTRADYTQCLNNTATFVKRGYVKNQDTLFVFNVIEGSRIPHSLRLISKYDNVKVQIVKKHPVDLINHKDVVELYLEKTTYFILLNCGCRGPYFDSRQGSWIDMMTLKLDESVKMVGPTISSEVSFHVQSYSVALDNIGMSLVFKRWQNVTALENKFHLIRDMEIGASDAILSAGYNIASFEKRYEDANFVTEMRFYPNGISENPTVCRRLGDIGCRGLDPCEVLFVKYGGEALRDNYIPQITVSRINEEDTKDDKNEMCKFSYHEKYPYVPDFKLSVNETLISETIHDNVEQKIMKVDNVSDFFLVVRAHGGYRMKLLSFLLSLDSVLSIKTNPGGRFRVLVISTDYESCNKLVQTIKRYQEVGGHALVDFVHIPKSIYTKYESFLKSICTASYKSFLSHRTKRLEYDYMRHCMINSPLHYILVDITLAYIYTYCLAAKWLLITNADNYYSPNLFRTAVRKQWGSNDVVLINFLLKGSPIYVKPKRNEVDLGSVIYNVHFLRGHHINFMRSLPYRSSPMDYHDADGHLTENVVRRKARVKALSGFYFQQN